MEKNLSSHGQKMQMEKLCMLTRCQEASSVVAVVLIVMKG